MTEEIPGWPWRPDLCPADLHYGEYLLDRWVPVEPDRPKVLHVGTGLHHHIGLLLGSQGFTVHGLTVSREEFLADLTNGPKTYVRHLGDIRDPAPHLADVVGDLDSMSLFHLGEPPWAKDGYYTVREVIQRAMTWSREVVFYMGSSAFPRIEPIIGDLTRAGKMRYSTHYKSLTMYEPIHG